MPRGRVTLGVYGCVVMLLWRTTAGPYLTRATTGPSRFHRSLGPSRRGLMRGARGSAGVMIMRRING